jgi:hypothetical protein
LLFLTSHRPVGSQNLTNERKGGISTGPIYNKFRQIRPRRLQVRENDFRISGVGSTYGFEFTFDGFPLLIVWAFAIGQAAFVMPVLATGFTYGSGLGFHRRFLLQISYFLSWLLRI